MNRLAVIAALSFAAAVFAVRGSEDYVFSLSWSPAFCADTRHDSVPECRQHQGFFVHGLWPQGNEASACDRDVRVPDDTIARMLPIMGERSLIIHEWRKHGACTGSSPEAYFGTVERLWRQLQFPPAYTAPSTSFTTSAEALQKAFIEAAPALATADFTAVCRGGELREIRVCLNGRLSPVPCHPMRSSCSGSILVRGTAQP